MTKIQNGFENLNLEFNICLGFRILNLEFPLRSSGDISLVAASERETV